MILWVLATAGAMLTVEPGNVELSARTHCAAEYPDDFAMQAACRRNYLSGAADFDRIAREFAGIPSMQSALRRCLADYRDEMTLVDYALAGACARNQRQGWQEMRR